MLCRLSHVADSLFEFAMLRIRDSGRWIDSEFCEKCGSAVTWTLGLVPGWRGFEGGTFDNSASFPCDMHMWTDSAHPSVIIDPNSTCFPQQPPFSTEQLEKL